MNEAERAAGPQRTSGNQNTKSPFKASLAFMGRQVRLKSILSFG